METTTDASVNIFDIVVLGIIAFGMMRGYKKGMITTVVGVFGVILAMILGAKFSYVFRSFFERSLDIAPQYHTLLGFAAVFVLVMIVLSFSFKFLENLLSQLKLGINQALGALFGGYIAAIALSVLLLLLHPINIPSQRSISDSITYPFMKSFAVDNLKLFGKLLPIAKNVLYQLDQSVRERMPDDGAGGGAQPAPAPSPVRE
ncbi:MAG: CvpA family protein [Bacteroidia bacterium]